MPKNRQIRPWQRDIDILTNVSRSPMTTSQIGELLGFPSPKKAAERLTQLFRSGFLKRVPGYQPSRQGKAAFIYYVGSQPKVLGLPHSLAIVDVRIAVHHWLARMPGLSGEFFYGHELRMSNPLADAALILRKNDRSALLFFEVDLGTESISSPRGNYSLAGKLAAYSSYFDSGGYHGDFEPDCFRGFRVALIVPSGRLARLQRLAAEEQHDFLFVSTFELLRTGLHNPIWHTHDGRVVGLVGQSRKEGGDNPGFGRATYPPTGRLEPQSIQADGPKQ